MRPSPSSLPQMPEKVSKQKKKKRKARSFTFENERLVRVPDVVKRPWFTTKFEKYATRGVGKNTDWDWFSLVGMPIFLSRISVEFTPACI